MARGKHGTAPLRRLSFASVLRRAGGVDKNTLKQPYHALLREEIELFLRECAGDARAGRKAKSQDKRPLDLEHYAQMLVASHIVRDEAKRQLADAEAEVQRQREYIAALEVKVAALQPEIVSIVPLDGGRS
ncbi:hypothetical protein C9E81_17630 [Paracoccus alkanivorans]|uniref:Uncharacterized protein n=2 Tax=Paracoccus alkanivorans TaxID=2116655 RepID=A0A3M0M4Y8_9RHOB|nr:hypothetical protein C9E81_17630 [Paracoccus alkanivorans]